MSKEKRKLEKSGYIQHLSPRKKHYFEITNFNHQCSVSENCNVNFNFEKIDNEAPAESRTVNICTANNEIEYDYCYYTIMLVSFSLV